MPDPVFNSGDRVASPPQPGLPKELEGKTPLEIAQYYQARERNVIATAREAISNNDPSKLPGAKPNTAVTIERETQPVVGATPEELSSARETMARTAKREASIGKKYWTRFEAQIDQMMNSIDASLRGDVSIWETCYNTLLGKFNDTIRGEEEEAARTAQTKLAAESSSPAQESTLPPPPLDSKVTSKVLPGLGITEEKYREAQKNIDAGKWPLTFDKAVR